MFHSPTRCSISEWSCEITRFVQFEIRSLNIYKPDTRNPLSMNINKEIQRIIVPGNATTFNFSWFRFDSSNLKKSAPETNKNTDLVFCAQIQMLSEWSSEPCIKRVYVEMFDWNMLFKRVRSHFYKGIQYFSLKIYYFSVLLLTPRKLLITGIFTYGSGDIVNKNMNTKHKQIHKYKYLVDRQKIWSNFITGQLKLIHRNFKYFTKMYFYIMLPQTANRANKNTAKYVNKNSL